MSEQYPHNLIAARRQFFAQSAALLSAVSAANVGQAQTRQDYKAMVCIFLLGANDCHNTLVPLGNSEYATYTKSRGAIALPVNDLLRVNTSAGRPYGLHNKLGAPFQALWNSGRLGAIANMGLLVKPTTKADFQAGDSIPSNLFSHEDQVVSLQVGTPSSAVAGTGWGGRTIDAWYGTTNPSLLSLVSTGGPSLFCASRGALVASLPPGVSLKPNGLNAWPQTAAAARAKALANVLSLPSEMYLVNAANRVRLNADQINAQLNDAKVSDQFPKEPLGLQLQRIAQIISANMAAGGAGVKRQVFFASLGGFDLHSSQLWAHGDLLRQLGPAMAAFDQAIIDLGLDGNVVTFTQSDFGRTVDANASGGCDHGWGAHHFVMGGSVKGGQLYGTFPDLTLGSRDDATGRGALIPTTSIDQVGATLATWFGVPAANLTGPQGVFPNLGSFQVQNLGFMKA
jgi:uncharacterized protein (DUF1501 family)